jgi:hypothetical protein
MCFSRGLRPWIHQVTLVFAVLHLAVVLLILLVATAWGYRVLEVWGVSAEQRSGLLAPAFSALEEEGKPGPIASTNLENLTGTRRIYRQRQEIQVILLQVHE